MLYYFYYWCNHSVTVYDTGALQFRLGCHLTLMLLQEFVSDQLLCYQQIMELLSIGSQLCYCCICGSLHIWDTPIVKFVTFCV